jgi:hypothetical protein
MSVPFARLQQVVDNNMIMDIRTNVLLEVLEPPMQVARAQ